MPEIDSEEAELEALIAAEAEELAALEREDMQQLESAEKNTPPEQEEHLGFY